MVRIVRGTKSPAFVTEETVNNLHVLSIVAVMFCRILQ